ncbi:hypothetical protein ACIGPN_05995 [Streptomyces afghaniensis]|uniref:hypothetical protein n=1 Tax=Streptomyces afghaniensis TaxID=66865 RepID=UPI0037D61AEC
MALRIFDTDPDAKPAPKPDKPEYERPAFQLRTGMQIPDPKNPKKMKGTSLANWRAVSEDERVTDALAELFGGRSEEYDPTKAQPWHVLMDTNALEVVIAGSSAIEDKLVQWGGPGGPIHECDGMYSLLPEDKGEPCGCPDTMAKRKELAAKGRGPKPSIGIEFTLAGAGEDLGKGKLIATAWTLAGVIHEVKDALDAVGEPALCRLEIKHVSYLSEKHGDVSYYHPEITVLGAYNDAIAEEA